MSDPPPQSRVQPSRIEHDIPPPGFVRSDPLALYAAYPGAEVLLQQLGLDTALGRLDTACTERGLDPEACLLQLALGLRHEFSTDVTGCDAYDIGELIDLILHRHHAWTRAELGRLAVLARALVDGDDLIGLLAHLGAKLHGHMWEEEHSLFPLCRAIEEIGHPAEDDMLGIAFRRTMHEHEELVAAVAEMMACLDAKDDDPVTRSLRAGLQALGQDLEQHLRLEDEFLMPAAASAAELVRSQERVRRRGATHISARLSSLR